MTRLHLGEIHTMIAESDFRPYFDTLRKLAILRNCVVLTLSGSLHRKLVVSVHRYMRLSSEPKASDMVVVPSTDPIGGGFEFDRPTTSDT